MQPTIRVDEDIYGWLQSQARPFEDTPNSVLRRIAGFENVSEVKGPLRQTTGRSREMKTPQQTFREPLLRVLKAHGGELARAQALKEIEDSLADQLTEHDRADISSGTIRWQKSAEWEVAVMREEGLLKPTHETRRGVWALTKKGWEAASPSSSR